MTLRVWAPRATSVESVVGDERREMHPQQDGWWELDEPVAPGTDYGFALDGGEALPDPRSPSQPDGVHGLSRAVDHQAFDWTDGDFRAPPLSSALIYEMHVGTFTPEGTFEAAIEHLDHLVGLGVTHLEMMPVNAFPGRRNWGYDGVGLFAPQACYGGPEGLKRLVDACHRRGLAVILDVVYNHLGPDGNYLERFGPYFTDRYHTPWGKAVNLDDRSSHEVRRFFCDNALMWLRDYHMDGLRIDAIHAFADSSATHLLEQMAYEVEALSARTGRPYALIAESDLNDPRVVRPHEVGGYQMDAQWSDDLHHALHAVLTGESQGYYADFGRLADVAKALENVFVNDGRYSPFRDRHHGRAPESVPGDRFVCYLQTHDQVGNRAQGDRIGHLTSPARVKIGSALVFCSPFVPMIFQGEEWNASTPFQYFTDHQDEALGRAVQRGRRREFAAFGWNPEQIPDPQSESTFRRSTIRWEELEEPPHRDMHDWYLALARIRREQPDLPGRREDVRVAYDEEAGWLVLERARTRVACNFASTPRRLPLRKYARERVLLSSDPQARLLANGVELPPESVVIVG